MTNNRQILVAEISVATFMQSIKGYCAKYLQNIQIATKNNFTKLGEDTINGHIWKCYLPAAKMGKNNRDLDSIEASDLLENVKHIDNIHLINHYKNISFKKLENIFITIVFINYENDEIVEKLQNALFIKSILKVGAQNGSVDTLGQEILFKKALKKDEKLTDFIDRTGKHPLVSFLGVNTRTLQSFGGKKNEKK